MVLSTLYAQSKGINALYKSVEISNQVAKDFSGLLSNVRKEQDLQIFFETHDPSSLGISRKGKLTPEVVQLALTLPALLALRYTDSERFKKISISGDIEGKFMEMAMSDYYVALSFLSEEDLRKEDSYVKLEQEGPSRQVQERKFDLGQMATNYATEVLVNAYPQTLVMGNPGVGKSTFANWLCHEWAGGRLSLDRIPIHVNLKEILSLDSPSVIVSYLAEQYVSCNTDTYLEVLRLLGDHFHFIFDGFDELSQPNRKKFRRLIRQFKEGRGYLNYTLLGRPYAFFDQHFQEARKFRIRGFNSASIERYLEATVGRLGDKDKSVTLLHKEVIGRNAILREYAHSPLILSYVVLVYLNQPLPVALRKLKGIRSKYDLYEEVYQWLADYNLRQKDIAGAELQEADFSFARSVSFQKVFRFQADSIHGEDFAKAINLSEHGLGSLDRNAIGERWRFGFSSVAIQEYLTARYMAQTINAEQFVYLSRDTFFWNICQLLVGALTRQGKEELLDKVFARLRSEQEEGASAPQGRFLRNRYAFFTYSLLVEGSEERLIRWAKSGGIDALFYDLMQHYFDPDWNEPLLEAATRMYQKMQLKGRQAFRRGIVKLLESVPQSDYADRMATRKLYVVLDLAFISEAGEDPFFCASLFKAIDSLVADHEALEQAFAELDDEDEDLYESTSNMENNQQEIGGAIFLLLQLAARIPATILRNYEKRIHELYDRVEFNFKEDVVYLLSQVAPREDSRGELEQLLEKVTNTLSSYTKINSVKNIFDQEVAQKIMSLFPTY